MNIGEAELADLAGQARQAYQRKDFNSALDLWTRVRQASPDDPDGFWGMGEALREMKMFARADHWLSEGIALFPKHHALRIGYAWVAAHRGDWNESERRFAAAVPLLPGDHAAHFGLALSRFELKKFAEAREALVPISDDGREHTKKLLGQIDTALARSQNSSADLPEQPLLARIEGLKSAGKIGEAEALVEEGLRQHPDSAPLLIGHAQLAQTANNWQAALTRWDKVKTAHPKLAAGYSGSAAALRALGRPADAELVLAPALRLFADDRELARQAAWAATDQREWAEAARRFRVIQQLDPQSPEGFAGEMIVFNRSGEAATVEVLGIMAIKRFPASLPIRAEYARAAEAQQSWPAALGRWRAMRRDFPQQTDPWAGVVRCLIGLGRLDEADSTAGEAVAAHPRNEELMRIHADLADRRKDKDVALKRWTVYAEAHETSARAALGLSRALIDQGKIDDAESVLKRARARFPNDVEIDVALARTSAHRRDWKTALTALADAKRQYGQHHLLTGAITDMLWQARQDLGVRQRDGEAEVIEIPQILLEQDQGGERDEVRKLLLQFESLGDSCEFGMVQRRFGAEPLSLLRWTGTTPDKLAEAIRDKFRAIGDPDEVKLENLNGEYITRIPRYGMFAHTFSLASATPFDKFFAAQCKRMAYLREKLLEDVEAAEKIFTYGSARLDDASVQALYDAFRGIGASATLLCVRPVDARHQVRTVTREAEGLLVGAIDRFSTTDIAVDDWVAVCREADRLRSER